MNRGAGEQAGVDERQRDAPKAPQAGAAETGGGFLHRRVDVGQRGNRVEVDDRIKAEGLDQDDPEEWARRKPIKGPTRRAQAERDEQGVDRAVLPEDLLDANRAHERRQNHRNQQEGGQQALARIPVPVGKQGEGHRNQQSQHRGRDRQQEGVLQAPEIQRIRKQLTQRGEAEASVGVNETALEDLEDRPKEEHGKEHRGDREHNSGERPRHRAGVW